jgi:hypothetical protein
VFSGHPHILPDFHDLSLSIRILAFPASFHTTLLDKSLLLAFVQVSGNFIVLRYYLAKIISSLVVLLPGDHIAGNHIL